MKPAVRGPNTVGIREFRATLAEYIDGQAPVTITRHGQAVGLCVPLRRPSAGDIEQVQAATTKFRQIMPMGEEEAADFDALRRVRLLPGRKTK